MLMLVGMQRWAEIEGMQQLLKSSRVRAMQGVQSPEALKKSPCGAARGEPCNGCCCATQNGGWLVELLAYIHVQVMTKTHQEATTMKQQRALMLGPLLRATLLMTAVPIARTDSGS